MVIARSAGIERWWPAPPNTAPHSVEQVRVDATVVRDQHVAEHGLISASSSKCPFDDHAQGFAEWFALAVDLGWRQRKTPFKQQLNGVSCRVDSKPPSASQSLRGFLRADSLERCRSRGGYVGLGRFGDLLRSLREVVVDAVDLLDG